MSYPHGTNTGYTNYACRCAACREAHRVTMTAWKAAQGRPAVHGSDSTYNNYACRCGACRAAHSAYRRGQRYQGAS